MRKKIEQAILVSCFLLGMLCVADQYDSRYDNRNDLCVVAAESGRMGITEAEAGTRGGVSLLLASDFSEAVAADALTVSGNVADVSGNVPTLSGNDTDVSGNGLTVSGNEAEGNDDESEYVNLAIADVSKYVNVRSIPSTDGEILGKIYDGAVAQILAVAGENNDWFQIVSGSVEGYIKSEYFIYGDAALAVLDDYVTRYAKVQVARLNVRKEPSVDAKRIGYIDDGEQVKILEDCGEWLKVQYTEEKEGYIAAEYVSVAEEFVYAKSIEEERAEKEAQRLLEERQAVSEQNAPETTTIVFPETTYTSNEELRKAIVEYAMQFLGGKYVHGGRSLESGTDCSGFTCYVYAAFGYSISRTPSGQNSSAGRGISYEEIQPGDIICYSSNGKTCTHVGMYIGDGQIIHAANSRKGVIISGADFDTIIGIRNVID